MNDQCLHNTLIKTTPDDGPVFYSCTHCGKRWLVYPDRGGEGFFLRPFNALKARFKFA